MMSNTTRISVIDTHTGGEPTRIIVGGGPGLDGGTLAERREEFARKFDRYRSAVVNEPRGSEVMVGALLCEPEHESSVAGVIFFNNVGCLNMCGHGTIGVAVALRHMGRIEVGRHWIDTPVGRVSVELLDAQSVRVENVPSYRYRANVSVDVPGVGKVVGDIAWGGNWFFLVGEHGETIRLERVKELSELSLRIGGALAREGIGGEGGALIDHVELFGPAVDEANHSRNFVMCPGGAFDRSPCGTGTSAKLACLAADGKLKPGEIWRQESIIGSMFEGSYQLSATPGRIIPSLCGKAYVNGITELIVDPADPFAWGIRA